MMLPVRTVRFPAARRPVALVALLCLLFAACSGPRAEAPGGESPREEERAPVTRTVQGFRIQIFTSPDRAEANDVLSEALAWYRSLPRSQRPAYLGGDELSADVKWRQPYYRVRVGDFATRGEADAALNRVRSRFPEAFIVPETVTVTR